MWQAGVVAQGVMDRLVLVLNWQLHWDSHSGKDGGDNEMGTEPGLVAKGHGWLCLHHQPHVPARQVTPRGTGARVEDGTARAVCSMSAWGLSAGCAPGCSFPVLAVPGGLIGVRRVEQKLHRGPAI